MGVFAVIPTAGTGERFGAPLPKPLVELCGKPVIAHTLAVFEGCSAITGIVLVVHAQYRKEYAELVDRYGFRKVFFLVEGGANRTQSVRNGLRAIPRGIDYVVIHDGVRPLVTPDLIQRGLQLVVKKQAVIAAVPVQPSLKVVDPATMQVCETLDRSLVWAIQTPQIFERELLDKAYSGGDSADDDAALVERCGVKVSVFMGEYQNIKITTTEDLVIAKAFLQDAARPVSS